MRLNNERENVDLGSIIILLLRLELLDEEFSKDNGRP